jgi:DNA-binding transcriptional MerR regulator
VYTVTDLARIAGANPRSVQHWAASGLLSPDPVTNRAGTGVRRLFSSDELIVACILQPLVEHQTPIGELQTIGNSVRRSLFNGAEARRKLTAILSGSQAWLVLFPPRRKNMLTLTRVVMPSIEEEDPSFSKVFEPTRNASVSIVLDLTASLRGVSTRLHGD